MFESLAAPISVGIYRSDDQLFRVSNYVMLTQYSSIVFIPLMQYLSGNQTLVMLADTNSFRTTINLRAQFINYDE